MAALPLPDEGTATRAKQCTKLSVKLRSHSGRFSLAKGGKLNKKIRWIDVGMIVRQHVERHCGDLCKQVVERRGVSSGWNVVAVAAPHRCFRVPLRRDRKNCGSQFIGHQYNPPVPEPMLLLRGAAVAVAGGGAGSSAAVAPAAACPGTSLMSETA